VIDLFDAMPLHANFLLSL